MFITILGSRQILNGPRAERAVYTTRDELQHIGRGRMNCSGRDRSNENGWKGSMGEHADMHTRTCSLLKAVNSLNFLRGFLFGLCCIRL